MNKTDLLAVIAAEKTKLVNKLTAIDKLPEYDTDVLAAQAEHALLSNAAGRAGVNLPTIFAPISEGYQRYNNTMDGAGFEPDEEPEG